MTLYTIPYIPYIPYMTVPPTLYPEPAGPMTLYTIPSIPYMTGSPPHPTHPCAAR